MDWRRGAPDGTRPLSVNPNVGRLDRGGSGGALRAGVTAPLYALDGSLLHSTPPGVDMVGNSPTQTTQLASWRRVPTFSFSKLGLVEHTRSWSKIRSQWSCVLPYWPGGRFKFQNSNPKLWPTRFLLTATKLWPNFHRRTSPRGVPIPIDRLEHGTQEKTCAPPHL